MTRLGVAVMAVLLVLYLVVTAGYSFALLGSGSGVGVALGIALLLFPILGAGALVAEVLFGVRAERLGRLAEADASMIATLPVHASGRPDRAAAEALFPEAAAQVEADPTDWRNHFRLALVYDAAGDRRRARASVREAIRRERAGRVSPASP